MATLRFLHRWIGLLLALPLLVQGITGTLLTLEPFLEGGPSGEVQAGSANAALATALAAAPGMRVGRYMPPGGESANARVVLLPPGGARGGALVAEVDPRTASLVGTPAPMGGTMQVIKRFHENWLVPELGGRQFAGWLGVGLTALVLLGIPLWWPTGGFSAGFTVPRRARGALLQRRLHGAMGGWLMLLLLVTGVTGITQGFPQTTRALLGIEGGRPGGGPGGPPGGGRAARPAAPAVPDLDAAVAQARTAAPGTVLRFAFLPPGNEPVRLIMGPPGSDGATTATTVMVDGASGRVVRVVPPEAGSFGEKFLRVAHDLHEGSGFGPVWRLLTAVAGVALPGFGVTGFLLWLLKRRNRARTRRRALDPALQGGAGGG